MSATLALIAGFLVREGCAADSGDNALEEIMVTATRTSQTADRVPVSLSAYNNQALEARGIRDVEDLFQLTPGVTFSKSGFANSNNISIRGINSQTGAGVVGIYIDDTPIQITNLGYSPTNIYPKLFDLDRVEILRGPQGTLFGAGSEGGTVRFITPQPSLDTWSGNERAEFGSIDGGGRSYEIGSSVGGPIVPGKLGFRASLYYRRSGGYVDRVNFTTGALLSNNTNYTDDYVARASLLWAITDRLKVTPSVTYQQTDLHDADSWWVQLSDPAHGRLRSGEPLGSPVPDHFLLPNIKVEYNAPGVDVISNTSYFRRENTPTVDYSTLIPGAFAGESVLPEFPNYRAFAHFQNRFRTFVQELRAQSSDPNAKLNWVGGVYFNDTRQGADEQIIDKDFGGLIESLYGGTLEEITGGPLIDGQYSYLQIFKTTTREISGFGDLGYEVLSGLKLTAGVRVSKILLSDSNYVTGPFNFGTIQGADKSSEHAVTPKVNLTWQINDDNMVYATGAKGFRPGGANVAIGSAACADQLHSQGYTQAPQKYDADSLWSYEIGTKNKLFGGGAQFAASVFHIKWSGIQQSIYLSTCGLSFTDNLGAAVSNGFDMSLNQRLGDFIFLAQVGYTDAHYSKDLSLGLGVPPLVRNGSALEQQPWTFSLGAQYNLHVFEHNSFARVDFSSRSGNRIPASEDPTTSSYTANTRFADNTNLANLRVGTTLSGIDLSVFCNNLFNSLPVQSGYTDGGAAYFRDVTVVPRTIGMTASYHF